ncbi:D-alanyl-D-alanine carboxypeptidase family protein [Alkalihalobacterium elongatum]|uniref:D-alanyl-D-alanine carboxypeptidase family protein n=1 Tax=Alkalihalobacterium elongatum TaxID=2675466 RepID=UPI001C1F8244|nr:D-alanyl-D-alanine carboxypeptidase family protein [Alkalihalobacterium elongatum]
MYRKKVLIICLSISLILSAFSFTGKSEAFSVSAQGAILIEQSSGRVLYGKNEHQQMRIASITKIMTAILAIESGKMDDYVKVSTRAEGTEGSSLYLKAGEKIKLKDLVYGLMLRSGNDAAVAIAEHVGGSLEGFVYLMNEKAQEIGMTRTVFSNPHGLDDHEEHYSTAYDMAKLTQYAMESEQYREISATSNYKAQREGDVYSYWKNKNRLLTQLYKYSTGGKTGFTKRAKRTLVSTATKDDLDLICVTLNAPSDWNDHMNLFNSAFDRYKVETLADEGTIKGIQDEFYKDRVYIPYTFKYPLTVKEREGVKKDITLYRPPKGEEANNIYMPQPVGKLTITMNGKTLNSIPLYFLTPIEEEKKGFWSQIKEIFFLTLGVKIID